MPGPPIFLIGLALFSALAGGMLGWYLHAERHRRDRLTDAATWQEKRQAEELVKEQLRQQIRSLAERLEAARFTDRDARRRLARVEGKLHEVTARSDEAAAALARCRAAVAASNQKRDELHAQLQRLLAHSREFMASSRAKDEKIFALSRELESWQERLPPLVYRFREKAREATAAHQALDVERARSRELEDTLRSRILPLTDAPVAADDGSGPDRATPVPRPQDDLKRIEGIGPVLEQLLNELGIHRLQQIARFGAEDVERVQAALTDFPERIERDQWVEQARRLIAEDRPEAGGTSREIPSETSWQGRTET